MKLVTVKTHSPEYSYLERDIFQVISENETHVRLRAIKMSNSKNWCTADGDYIVPKKQCTTSDARSLLSKDEFRRILINTKHHIMVN
jgi:hypothetical protein